MHTSTEAQTARTYWFIFDGVGPADGEFHATKPSLFLSLSSETAPDIQVFEFTPSAGTCPDVSEAIAAEYWNAGGDLDAYERLGQGREPCGLFRRFYAPELEALSDQIARETREYGFRRAS